MNRNIKVLKNALDLFKSYLDTYATDNQDFFYHQASIEALSEIEKCEPVAWLISDGFSKTLVTDKEYLKTANRFNWEVTELYTSPISKEWVVIDEETIDDIGNTLSDEQGFIPVETWTEFARAIEAKLKQLNAVKG